MPQREIKRLLLQYRIVSLLTLMLGLSLSIAVFLAADAREQSARRRSFENAALAVQAEIIDGLLRSSDYVEAVGALIDSNNDVTHPQFDVFAKQLLRKTEGIQALEWIPRVPLAERERYERTAQGRFPDFRIKERRFTGEFIPASQREEYFPVYFVEPEVGNKAAIGYDLASDHARLRALNQARDSGQPVATGRIALVQETGKQYGFLLFRPVYRDGRPHATPAERRENVLGFALGVFRAGDVVEKAAGHLRASGIRAVLYDESAPELERFLVDWPAMSLEEPSAAAAGQYGANLERSAGFDIGGRRWRLVLTPTAAFYAGTPLRPVWAVLFVGIALSLLLAYFIETVRSHIREELESRQARLAAEGKLTDILDSIDSMLISIMLGSGELTYANPAAERVFGRSAATYFGRGAAWLEAIHPEDQARVRQYLSPDPALPAWTDEVRIVRSDGEVRWVRARIKVVRDANGRAERIDIVASDITQQRQAEAERNRAEQKALRAELHHRAVFEEAPVGILIIEPQSTTAVEFNDVAHVQLGYTREEFARLQISDYQAVYGPEELGARVAKILDDGGDSFETRHRRKDGVLRDVHVMVRAIELGQARYLYCIYQDITEQKADKAALVRANRALKTLSAVNEEVVHAQGEQALLESVCRIVIKEGGYRMAGVGYPQDDAQKSIRPMARNGGDERFISAHPQTWADTALGQRPISKAIRTAKPQVARNLLADPTFADWQDDARTRGYSANLALPLIEAEHVFGVINIYAAEPDAFDAEEIALLRELADNLAYGIVTLRTRAERDRIALEHSHHEETLRRSLEESIRAIADTVEMRDAYTAGHQRRVSALAVAIARELSLSEERIHGIGLAANIHDLGKIKVPAEILAKPSKISDIEMVLVKGHVQAGYEILKDISFPWPISTVVRQHHERLDGSGYPQGLKGNEILLESRIVAVADVVEAIASHRPYRPALGLDAALSEIRSGAGRIYDAAVVDACIKLFRERNFSLPK